ncbi:MAG TPA: DUF1553 domain-containing protein [Candidatus Acidoferrales bacterium]|jgi:hypothetical protein|nr:DUF1553 domain-containing protein [Candidatus Acidoferrales bacterium]
MRKLIAVTTGLAMSLAIVRVKLAAQAPPGAAAAIDFQRQIRPILSDSCFQCHGPDSSTRMAGLRLDLKDTVFEVRPHGAPVVPRQPEASLLYQRISALTAARRMPPERAHKDLTPQQIALLKRWIEQGAPWQEHWAFRPPAAPRVPQASKTVRNATWPKNPIDRFVLARLESQSLEPAPAADARTLIRRVALDLTGLPPKPAEIEIFLKDAAPGAYERMVDRYLASPHYGEHRARYWLDAARYADTNGIHVDNYREMWPYRDWVIQAFNRNLGFDQFSIEQLAGDLLPNPTMDQLIATGFHRCAVTTNEAGVIEDEYAEIYAKDRADTTGAVWLGMTIGCATCHDHKFDPISQKDFYALGAFFRNTTQAVMDGNVHDAPPIITVPRQEDRADWERIASRRAAIRAEMENLRTAAAADFRRWREQRETIATDQPLGDQSEIKSALPKLEAEKPFSISVRFRLPLPLPNGPGPGSVAGDKTYIIAAQQNQKEKGRGWVLDVSGRRPGFRLIGDDGKGIEIRAGQLQQLQPGVTNHVVVSYDGERHHTSLSLFVNGKAIPLQGRGNGVLELPGSINAESPVVLGRPVEKGAMEKAAIENAAVSDFRIFDRVVTESEAALLSQWPAVKAGDAEADDEAFLLTYFLVRQYQPFRKLAAELQALNTEVKPLEGRAATAQVMHEKPDSTPFAYVLYRGAYDQKRQRVDATTPAVLPPMTSDLPRNRLGFARWLFTKDHPLTARVAVNRMWQEIFGTGIVKTVDDFGSQGEAPSHPELLDWLALDFRDHQWDMKRFYKQILLSATYRQAALATPEKVAKDPDNRLLSRGPRYRMEGEMVRDYALAASDLLAPQIGGPSARPYQPEGVWEAVAMEASNTRFYKRDSGDGLHRRSLYTFWKRSAPPASMDIFNAPTREGCTVRRERTDTPLQALVTMNDVQFMAAARGLAEHSMEALAGFDQRLDFIATRVLARPLALPERQIAGKAFQDFRRYYDAHPADARKLLNVGEEKPDPALPPAELAALTMLANQLLNLDEVLNK